MSKLFAVVDKKSACAEYFIAACDEDALRIWYVMACSSRPMFEFLDEYFLEEVCSLPDSRTFKNSKVVLDGTSLKRQIEFRKEQTANEKSDV